MNLCRSRGNVVLPNPEELKFLREFLSLLHTMYAYNTNMWLSIR